jgi:hypothetical protein
MIAACAPIKKVGEETRAIISKTSTVVAKKMNYSFQSIYPLKDFIGIFISAVCKIICYESKLATFQYAEYTRIKLID